MQNLLKITALLFLVIVVFFLSFPITTLVKTSVMSLPEEQDHSELDVYLVEYDSSLLLKDHTHIILKDKPKVFKSLILNSKD